jgi:hypothetical protein
MTDEIIAARAYLAEVSQRAEARTRRMDGRISAAKTAEEALAAAFDGFS